MRGNIYAGPSKAKLFLGQHEHMYGRIGLNKWEKELHML